MESLRAVDMLVLRTLAELHGLRPTQVDFVADAAGVHLATALRSVRILSQHHLVELVPHELDGTNSMAVRLTAVAIRALDAPTDPPR